MSGPETAILAPMRYATLVVNRLRANAPFRPGAGPIVTTRVPPPLDARVVGRRQR